MSFNFQGHQLLPGPGADLQTSEGQIWWGKYDQQVILGAILDKDTVDGGNTPTTLIRTGMALGYITATKQLTHWNPYATDGSNRLAGFFMGEQTMDFYGTPVERFVGNILVGGNVYASELLIPGEANKGIAGKSYEFLLREQMRDRFLVDDDLGMITGYKVKEITANYTAVLNDHNTHFINLGAAGAVTLTLPAPVPGLEFMVSVLATQNIVLEGPATGEYSVPLGTTANNDTMTGTNHETVRILGIRTAATPTYQYMVTPVPA